MPNKNENLSEKVSTGLLKKIERCMFECFIDLSYAQWWRLSEYERGKVLAKLLQLYPHYSEASLAKDLYLPRSTVKNWLDRYSDANFSRRLEFERRFESTRQQETKQAGN